MEHARYILSNSTIVLNLLKSYFKSSKIMVGMIIVELLHPDLKYVHFRILKMDIKRLQIV
jgi:hypothetical protein